MFYIKIESDGEGDPIELAVESVQKVPPALIVRVANTNLITYSECECVRKALQESYGDIPILFVDNNLSVESADFDTLVQLRHVIDAALVKMDV